MNDFNLSMCKSNYECLYRTKCLLERKCLSIEAEQKEEPLMLGEIHSFPSGASTSSHLPPYECLTLNFLSRAARRMEKGMHYGKHNWKKGTNDKAFILDRLNHAMEHLILAMREIDDGVPADDDNLAAVVVNCMFAMEYKVKNE